MSDPNAIADFIARFSFGIIVSSALDAAHIPFIYKPEEGERGVLYGHVAKANKLWRELDQQRVLIIFNGPDAYISSTWYAGGPAVPTWNYAAVHCLGTVSLCDTATTARSIQWLMEKHDPEVLQRDDLMPDDYQQKLLKGVVGLTIKVDTFYAKEKLGQQRAVEDQRGVYHALKNSEQLSARELADYMEARKLGTGYKRNAD